jgi:hypothetical protein
MRTETRKGLQVLRRLRDFLMAIHVMPAIGPIEKLLEQLSGVIEHLSAHAVEQETNERAFRSMARMAQLQARVLRLELMRPVERLGKALFRNDAAILEELTVPASHAYEQVIAAALAMAERVAEHRDRFVAAGFSDGFDDRLREAAVALRKSIDMKAEYFGRRSAATAGMRAEFVRGRDMVRLLDSMVAPRLEVDGLAQWRTLSRFARVSRGAGETEPGGTPEATSQASEITETTGREHAA